MLQKTTNTNGTASSEDKLTLKNLFHSWTFWKVYGTSIFFLVGLIASFYQFGKENGQAKFEKEKADCYEANRILTADTLNKSKIIAELGKKISAYLTTFDLLSTDKKIENSNDTHINKPEKREQNHKFSRYNKDGETAKTVKVNEQETKRINELQIKLDIYEELNKKLIDENDNLKSEVSIMQQRLQRARELEEQIKHEQDNYKKSILAKQRDELIAKVENKMKQLTPSNSQKPLIKIDTVTITKTYSVPDYEKFGDNHFNKAKEMEEKLDTQQDSYFLGLKKNQTKTDFVFSALRSYNDALTNYKLANKLDKIKNTEEQIKKFKVKFAVHLKK